MGKRRIFEIKEVRSGKCGGPQQLMDSAMIHESGEGGTALITRVTK